MMQSNKAGILEGNRIILNTTVNEIRVALVEDGRLTEFFVERADIERMIGNIYKGRVVSVHSGLKAAFVDIDANKAAFLPLTWVSEENDFDIDEDSSSVETVRVESGNELLVQVIKDPLGTKGARVTTNVSIPGKFLVLTPLSNKVAVSRKIPDRKERDRLKRIIRKLKPKDMGFIIRTAAEGGNEKDFQVDIKRLLRIWSKIRQIALKKTKKNVPALIHKDTELVIRLMRDLLTERINEVVVDSKEEQKKILKYISFITPGMAKKVNLYQGKESIFRAYKIQNEITTMLNKRIKLKSGGYIIIEPTEALVAIDVNSGKSLSATVPEKLALITNLEAATEIAQQLRLRDIGGIIVVDFIDMEKARSREQVLSTFKKAMRGDRARYKLLCISNLGLMEMTRKRVSPEIAQSFFDICPVCEGKGKVLSQIHLSLKVIRGIESKAKKLTDRSIILYGHPEFIDFFSKEFSDRLAHFSRKFRISIQLRKDAAFSIDSLKIFDNEKLKDITGVVLE
ncbi:MAG: Rne/Rng family ribonuclease [Candidatus Cloacimonadota bacterium]|nr:MAG: Rne/Rng family ribonuclease [Candidatus Cloacimonadota bacterium]